MRALHKFHENVSFEPQNIRKTTDSHVAFPLQTLHGRHRLYVGKIDCQISYHRVGKTSENRIIECLHGRPISRMKCLYVIGRESWVWVEQGALKKREFPPQRGGGRPNWRGAIQHENSTGDVRV